MNQDEWHAMLATEPASSTQVGAVRGEFARLGFRQADRAERLAVSAALVGRDRLESTADLVMGEAGQLIKALRQFRDRDELATAAASSAERQSAGLDRPEAVSLASAIARAAMLAAAAWRQWQARPPGAAGVAADAGRPGAGKRGEPTS
jgi:hypothetical protein